MEWVAEGRGMAGPDGEEEGGEETRSLATDRG